MSCVNFFVPNISRRHSGLKGSGPPTLRCIIWSHPFLGLHTHALHLGTIQGKEGITFCHLATLPLQKQKVKISCFWILTLTVDLCSLDWYSLSALHLSHRQVRSGSTTPTSMKPIRHKIDSHSDTNLKKIGNLLRLALFTNWLISSLCEISITKMWYYYSRNLWYILPERRIELRFPFGRAEVRLG